MSGIAKSSAFETQLLEYIFKGTAFPWDAATNIVVNLHTADPGEGGTTATSVATYGAYAPVVVSRSGAGFGVTGAVASNAALIQFPTCTSGSNVITHFSVSPQGDTMILYRGALSAPLTVTTGVKPQVDVGAFTVTEY
jgi:hypothetical protein